MNEFSTISEAIAACRPDGDKQKEAWAAHARYWGMAGAVLPPAVTTRSKGGRSSKTGRGHHRRYRPDDVYLMAIMFRLADITWPISTLASISEDIQDYIRTGEESFSELWEEAKLGKTERPVFLSILFDAICSIIYVDFHYGPHSTHHEDYGEPIIIMNVSKAFEGMRGLDDEK